MYTKLKYIKNSNMEIEPIITNSLYNEYELIAYIDTLLPFKSQCYLYVANIIPFLRIISKSYNACVSNAIQFNNTTKKLKLIKGINDEIVNLIMDSNCKTIIIPLSIFSEIISDNLNHSNIIIITKNTDGIEIDRFESNGKYVSRYDYEALDKEIYHYFNYILSRHQITFSYYSPVDLCPIVGAQRREIANNYNNVCTLNGIYNGGFCVIWSLLYAQLRIISDKSDRRAIINRLNNLSDPIFLQKYIRYISITLNSNGIPFVHYEGELDKDGNKSGIGKMFYKNSIYEGQWKNNQFNGIGIYTGIDRDGKVIYKYEGKFKDNKKDDMDAVETLDEHGNQIIYKGPFKNDYKDGKGILIINGKQYNAEYKDGNLINRYI